MVNSFQLVLFYKYAELLKRRFGEDFQEIVSTDDYMPMPIPNREEYQTVLDATWFVDERPPEEIRYVSTFAAPGTSRVPFPWLIRCSFPTVLPFSKMYPLCCMDIRSFADQFLQFTQDNFDHLNVVDETLRKVCASIDPQHYRFSAPA